MSQLRKTASRSRAQLSAFDVTIVRGDRTVLDGLSIAVTPGDRLGIVGENGAGKSTLLHLLVGRLRPDRGRVVRHGSFGLAEQEVTVDERRTVGELIDVELADARRALAELDDAGEALADDPDAAADRYEAALDTVTALDAWNADRRVELALDALGAIRDRDRRLITMSVGERYRVRLACLLGAGHDFLVLDEPTNHLDAHGLDFLTTALRDTSSGVVLVSHDRVLLDDVVSRVLDLDPTQDGVPRLYGDGYAGYLAGREAEMARWQQAFDSHASERQRLADDLSAAQNRLQSGWRPPKGTGKHTRATRAPSLVRNVKGRIADLESHEVSAPRRPLRLAMPEMPSLPSKTLLAADGVRFEGRLGEVPSLSLYSGDRLVVTGANGAGKSTLLAVLAGRLRPDSGTVVVHPEARIAFVAQEAGEADDRPARVAFDESVRERSSEAAAVSLSSLGLLSTRDANRPTSELSMGQRRRLDLAIALATKPHLVMLDEPTNHLSIRLVDELTEALCATAAAVVVVTHDRQLRRDLARWPHLELAPVR